MRLEIGRGDHHGATFGLNGGQALHHPDEDARLAPPLPAIVQRLVQSIDRRLIAPAQPVTIDEDDPAQHPAIIHPRLAVALGETGPPASHLLVCQPIQIAHIQSPQEPESDRSRQINGS